MKTPLPARIFIKNCDDTTNPSVRNAYGNLGGVIGIVCNLLLFAIKLTAGLISGSLSILADAFNNLSDMGSSVVTMLGFRLSAKPADREHPFGHGRMEYMSAFIVSGLILVVGFELLKSSVEGIISPKKVTYSIVAIVILILSVILKFLLFFINRSLGKAVNSSALIATAQDSINDTITTIAILISIPISSLLNFSIDPFVSLGISIFILYSGIKTAKEALDPLLGAPPEPDLIRSIKDIIMQNPDFIGIHDLIIHNYGPGRMFASVHVEVPQNINIVTCHEQIDLCEKDILQKTGVEIVIHMDPIASDDKNLVSVRSALAEAIADIDPSLSMHDFRMTPKTDHQTNLIFDVVIPPEYEESLISLKKQIILSAQKIDPTFQCVITFDRDFTGHI